MTKIHVDVDGTFDTFEEAATAMENVASTLREGRFQCIQSVYANPMVFITSDPDDAELEDEEAA